MQAEDNVVEIRRKHEAPVTPSSFDELFLDQHDRLYRALYFVTGNREDAEELMQEAFLKLWDRWDTIATIDDPVVGFPRIAEQPADARSPGPRGGWQASAPPDATGPVR